MSILAVAATGIILFGWLIARHGQKRRRMWTREYRAHRDDENRLFACKDPEAEWIGHLERDYEAAAADRADRDRDLRNATDDETDRPERSKGEDLSPSTGDV